jgi:hypothetical protein
VPALVCCIRKHKCFHPLISLVCYYLRAHNRELEEYSDLVHGNSALVAGNHAAMIEQPIPLELGYREI